MELNSMRSTLKLFENRDVGEACMAALAPARNRCVTGGKYASLTTLIFKSGAFETNLGFHAHCDQMMNLALRAAEAEVCGSKTRHPTK